MELALRAYLSALFGGDAGRLLFGSCSFGAFLSLLHEKFLHAEAFVARGLVDIGSVGLQNGCGRVFLVRGQDFFDQLHSQ